MSAHAAATTNPARVTLIIDDLTASMRSRSSACAASQTARRKTRRMKGCSLRFRRKTGGCDVLWSHMPSADLHFLPVWPEAEGSVTQLQLCIPTMALPARVPNTNLCNWQEQGECFSHTCRSFVGIYRCKILRANGCDPSCLRGVAGWHTESEALFGFGMHREDPPTP
jgi:hypothetical protein